ncbi:MAG: UbiA family prenyltransferase [Desulfurococcales archaeon]|nr:UbiA family prenyltransferase [Desulfurococcales archaeon]
MGRSELLRACLESMRPVNSAMLGFAVLVGALIASGSPPPLGLALPAFVAGFAVGASAMVLNDIADVEIDRVNAPHRPIPSGRMSVAAAWACFAALSLAGLAAAAYTGVGTLAVALAAWASSVAYNLKLKRSGLPGNAIVAFNVAVPLLYGGALVGRLRGVIVVFWAMVFLSALAREIVKGIADVEGDRAAGVATVAVRRGPRAAATAAAALYLLAVALSPLPALKGWVHTLGYSLPVAVVDAVFVYAALRVARRPDRETALWHKRVVLIAMLIGLVGFYLGVSLRGAA